MLTKKVILLFSLCLLMRASDGAAQHDEPLDFLSGLQDFQNLREMFPAYLKSKADVFLRERQHSIQALSGGADIQKRRSYVREQMLQALGGLPERTPLNARVVGVLDEPDHRIEKIIFESQPQFYVTANLYVPKMGQPPYPAILYPLGHERGGKAHETWQIMMVSLTRRGFVVLAWDPVGQGERHQLYDSDLQSRKVASTTEHTLAGIQSLLLGGNLARYTIWDGIRALDYLLSRPEVDPQRIGCTGNSGGGTHTAYLSALDDRIHVAAPSCYLTSWERLLATIGPQDAEQVLLPWVASRLDHADFVHAFAPKPYLILSAIRDFFSILGARQTYSEAKQIYNLLGEEGKLQMFEADDGHGYNQPRRMAAYRWFSRWLQGEENGQPESPVNLKRADELYCTPTGQVLTSLGGETVFTLNQKRFEQLRGGDTPVSSAQQLQARQEETQDLARKLLNFDPGKVLGMKPDLQTRTFGKLERDGYSIEKLTYRSEPGIIIPCLLFVPDAGPARKPAVLYVHGAGKSAGAAPGGHIEEMVKAGSIVLAIDSRGSGETGIVRNPDLPNQFLDFFGDYDGIMTPLLLDQPLVGMRALDISRGVDLLENRPDVDPQRISGFGVDGGGVPMLYAAVLDERIRNLAFERLLVSYESMIRQPVHRHMFENVVPGVLKSFDLPDLTAALAPRPVWIVDAVDPLGQPVPEGSLNEHYSSALSAYRAAGAGDSLRLLRRSPGQTISWLR